MSAELRAALTALSRATAAQERAYQAARAASQEFYHTRARQERPGYGDPTSPHIDPNFNMTAGRRVYWDKIVVDLARRVTALFEQEAGI